MTDMQAWLDQGKTFADQATEGPWGGTWNGAREGNIAGETDVLDATNVNAQDLSFITDARTRLPQALNALQAILDLHKPVEVEPYGTICAACSNLLPNGRFLPIVEHPCLTVQTAQNALGTDA